MKPTFLNLYLLIVIFGLAIAVFYSFYQEPNIFYENEKADANEYLKIFEYFRGERDWNNIRFGIHNRILIPYLAALLPWEHASHNFFIINTLFALLSLIALFYLLKQFEIENTYRFLILTFFSLHYVGPFRHNAINPINVDVAVYLFEILLLLLLHKRRYVYLIFLLPAAIATKEIFLALAVAILFINLIRRYFFNDYKVILTPLYTMLFIGILTKWFLNEIYPSASPGRNSIIVMLFHLREFIFHPDHLWRWLLSLFAAYGCFLFLLLKNHRNILFKRNDILTLHLLSLSVLALSIVGGMDYTRLIFLGFPYIITSIFIISKPNRNLVWITFIMSLFITRFWMKLPVISKDLKPYNYWMPEVANVEFLYIWTSIVLVALGIFFMLKKFFGPNAQSWPNS